MVFYRFSQSLAAVFAGLSLFSASTLWAERIVFEAESAPRVEAPMRMVHFNAPPADAEPVAGASGDAYLEIPAGAGNPPKLDAGKAVFEIDIPRDGSYILWCRVYWDDSCSNSFSVQIDDGPVFSFGQTAIYKTWHWVRSPPRVPTLNLKSGTRRIAFLNREDGIRIDQVILTTQGRFRPVDQETVNYPPDGP